MSPLRYILSKFHCIFADVSYVHEHVCSVYAVKLNPHFLCNWMCAPGVHIYLPCPRGSHSPPLPPGFTFTSLAPRAQTKLYYPRGSHQTSSPLGFTPNFINPGVPTKLNKFSLLLSLLSCPWVPSQEEVPTTEVGKKISSCNSTTARSVVVVVVVVVVLLVVVQHISIKLQTEHPYMMVGRAQACPNYVCTYDW